MTDIVDDLRGRYRDTKQMIPCELEHRAAQEIESLRQQLAEALSVRENCTLVPTHELKKLQEQLAEKDEEIESFKSSYESTYEQNLRLANQLGESEAERLEQARLLGMSGEREAGLLAEIERIRADYLSADSQAGDNWQQLAASQAREQKLRNHIALALEFCDMSAFSVEENLINALTLPQDTTALDQLKAQVAHEAGEVMRNRCKLHVGLANSQWEASQRLYHIQGVTLKDLK